MKDRRNQQIVVIWVENKPGVLNKITSLCRRKRYNIKSLTVGETHLDGISHITLVFEKEEDRIHNIINHTGNLIEVISVTVENSKDVIDKELVLIVTKTNEAAVEIIDNYKELNIKINSKLNGKVAMEIIGDGQTIDKMLKNLDYKKVDRLVRSGLIAMKYK